MFFETSVGKEKRLLKLGIPRNWRQTGDESLVLSAGNRIQNSILYDYPGWKRIMQTQAAAS